MEDEELNKISRFMSKSTENWDDWDWDGEELKVFIDDEVVETYSKKDLIEAGVL